MLLLKVANSTSTMHVILFILLANQVIKSTIFLIGKLLPKMACSSGFQAPQ